MNRLQGSYLCQPFLGPWAGAQASMPTAFGLAGYDRLAAKVGLIFKVRGACRGFGHGHNGITIMDHRPWIKDRESSLE